MRKYPPGSATLLAFREVVSRNTDGTFTYGRTILVPSRNGRAALQPNPVCPGTMVATIKLGAAYVTVVVDPNSWVVRK